MLLIQTTDYYLYTKKRDIFILEIKNQDTSKWNYSDNLANQQIEQEQRSWFLARNINIAHTVPPSLIAGWNGQLYVDLMGGTIHT